MKFFQFFLIAALFPAYSHANEGMWLPHLIKELNMDDMRAAGLELSAEDIYSVNNSSLKDAIVSLGGFCTGEIISEKGLILTNHHCGYGSIQTHSSTENDYLSDGFWAKSMKDEKPNEGLFVRFLVSIQDVTDEIVQNFTDEMTENDRAAKAAEIGKEIISRKTEETHYIGEIKSFLHGNEYYLMVYERFDDVRLVGAPPSSIGKFGGDTDNWMWPRHTGDFSLFRVYSGPDGKPAAYSEDNIPLKPKHHLPISLDGVEEGDFSMVFGFPGSTDRYLSSFGVKQAIEKHNPAIVDIREVKLGIMKEAMNEDAAVRIKMASKYAQTANYWKYFIGQTKQLDRNNIYDRKKELEKDFTAWIETSGQAKYDEVLRKLEVSYAETDKTVVGNVYLREAGLTGPSLTLFVYRAKALLDAYVSLDDELKAKKKEAESSEDKEALEVQFEERRAAIKKKLEEQAKAHFKSYEAELDEKLVAALWQKYYDNVDASQQPEFFRYVEKKFKGDFSKMADKMFSKSFLTDEDRFMAFLEKPKAKKLKKDLAYQASSDIVEMYFSGQADNEEVENDRRRAYRLLTEGLREMQPERKFYPDANSTLRLTWGTVGSYFPADGTFYNYYTTTQGILEKKDPDNPEFVIPEKLVELIKNKDFGRYANEDGELVVNFISNNDITGGNSGSPVINGKGELIGCAFDGNWEAMSGDISFEEKMQRTISVDARYILFIIDKFADAGNLIEEMTIVQAKQAKSEKKEEAESKESALAN